MRQTFQGTALKITLILLSALLSTFAYADLAEMHQQNCESEVAKKAMGKTGSCRIVIAPKPTTSTGRCTGNAFETIPCTLTYSSIGADAVMNLTCGEDPANPMINQDMQGRSVTYNVATIISKPGQKEAIINDPDEYKLVSNSVISLLQIGTASSIVMYLENSSLSFTNVQCN